MGSLKGARMVTNRPGSALAHMSPAAQRLASGKLGIRLGTDHMLRSSYTPSPARKSRGTPTPSRGDSGSTPTPRATPGKVTPSNGGRAARGITDNLLNIGKAHGQNRA